MVIIRRMNRVKPYNRFLKKTKSKQILVKALMFHVKHRGCFLLATG